MLCRYPLPEFTARAVPALVALLLGAGCGQTPTHGNPLAPASNAGHVSGGDAGSLLPEPDPDCGLHLTAYPGDCKAPPAIDPSLGVVAHYGPRDYDDPEQIAEYLVQPGEELVDCAYSTLSNDQDLYYARYDVYSRPGMHHVILSATNTAATDGLHDDCTERDHGSQLLAVLQGGIRGNVYHYPPSDNQPPENAGIGTKLPPHQSIAYELHAVNTTERPLLKENWTVFYAMPADQVTQAAGQIAFNGGLAMNIPPHTQQTIQNSCLVNKGLGKIRVTDFFGHMHAHGKRFSAWAVQTDDSGAETHTLIYESYDWSKLDLIEFNSVQKNTPVVYKSGAPGGISGDLFLSPGDRIEYECEMDNTENFSLNFAAKALTGEMCNLFGSFTPGGLWTCVGY
jgi:hypothetical protein